MKRTFSLIEEVPPEADEFALLKYAQEFGLERGWQLCHFVEEDVPPSATSRSLSFDRQRW